MKDYLKISKDDYFGNHWSDHTQILDLKLSLDDHSKHWSVGTGSNHVPVCTNLDKNNMMVPVVPFKEKCSAWRMIFSNN